MSAIRAGDRAAESRLLELVTGELRRLAARMMRQERAGHTLQPTALVNELYIELVSGSTIAIQNRGHFFALAAQAMRRILVDHARAARSKKRGGDLHRVEFEIVSPIAQEKPGEILELDQALQRLEKLDARQCRVVELRYFAGLDELETAATLGVSARTVRRDWSMAKAWLYGELTSRP